MNNVNYNINTAVFTKDQASFELYKNFIKNLKVESVELIDLDQKDILINNYDICIVDINHKKEYKFINTLFEHYKYRLIIISPFPEQKFNHPNVKESFCISKPIHFNKFSNIFKNFTMKLLKELYLTEKNTLITEMVEESKYRIGIYDDNAKLIYANQAYLLEQNITNPFEEEVLFKDISVCKLNFKEIKETLTLHKYHSHEILIHNRWYKSTFYTIHKGNCIVHIYTNTTELKNKIENLQKEALFFKETNEGVLITNEKGYILAVNTAFCKITGYTKDEIIGKSTNILASGMHTKDFYQNMWDTLKYHGIWQGEIWNKRKNGEVYPEWLSISACVDHKTSQKTYMALFTDISSIKETDKKLHFYANHDQLTGLLNRVQFDNMLHQTIKKATRGKKKFALIFIDLDHFKEVNDTYGHNIGDILLKLVAERFQATLRKEDIIARIGGDEFTIILDDIKSQSDTMLIAQKLISAIKEPIIIETHSCFVSLSIGIAIYPNHGLNAKTLSKNADSAMYQVKKAGRDGAIVYHSNFSQDLAKKVSFHNDLKKAILQKQITMCFQPIIDINSKKIIAAEALVRWKHPKKGDLTANEFIAIAEQQGMIIDLGEIIFISCLESLRVILKEVENTFKLAINISAREFFDHNFIPKLLEKTEDFCISAKNIELEITETYIMKNHLDTIKKFNLLKEKGFSLAIDDFGTGFSSLNYLKLFPIDKLKIDNTFISNLTQDKGDKAIAKSIIELANSFEFQVQAEGVESQDVADELVNMNCYVHQGFYYAKPMGLDDFIQFIREFDA